MINPIKPALILVAVLAVLLFACQPKSTETRVIENNAPLTNEPTVSKEEEEIKAAVEKLLFAAGNYNFEVLDEMVSDKAILGYSYFNDGSWSNNEMTIDEYFENNRNRELKPFSEIPTDYDIILTDGRLASVRADAILYQMGVAKNREINHMTMMKEGENWKFLSISWTVRKLPKEERIFNQDIFARSYARAWCSNRPEFVAMYFAEDGVLQVNDGEPAKGREAIAKIAQSFMTDLPDMTVRYDSLVKKADGIFFYWTLIATNSGPGGNGNKINVSGYERWQLTDDGRIKSSMGNFPTEEYNRQLEFGEVD